MPGSDRSLSSPVLANGNLHVRPQHGRDRDPLPPIASFNRPMVPGFVIEFEHIDTIANIGGDSVKARIYGLRCQ